MIENDFVVAILDPEAWYARSRTLRLNGRVLAAQVDQVIERLLRLAPPGGPGSTQHYSSADLPKMREVAALGREMESHMDGARLCYGLALETALKGRIVAAKPLNSPPSSIELALKQLGIKTHNLPDLMTEAGVLNAIPLSAAELALFEGMLRELRDAVVWSVRYPSPVKMADVKFPDLDGGKRLMTALIEKALDAILPPEPPALKEPAGQPTSPA